MNVDIECSFCGDSVPGMDLKEAVLTAQRYGWDTRYSHGRNRWYCTVCLADKKAEL